MTDRIHSVTVTLEKEMRVDHAESILNAIRMIKGVIDVSGNVSNFDHHVALKMAKIDLQNKHFDVLTD